MLYGPIKTHRTMYFVFSIRQLLPFAFLASMLLTSAPVQADDTKYYFLKETTVGNEANFNPFTVFVNTGFDITRSGSYSNRLTQIDYQTGAKNIVRNIWSINENVVASGGWADFISHEIFPYVEFNLSHGHFVPNYFLHAIGEGMLYRKLEEWYRSRGVAWSKTSALATLFVSQFLNETVENGSYEGPNTDPIADMVFFNPLGWLLFSLDSVAQFFSETITMGMWQGQPSIDLRTLSLYNAGESYFFRSHLGGRLNPFSLFGYIGSEGLSGVSWKINSTDSITLSAGYRVVWLEPRGEPDYRQMAPVEPGNWLGGFFWDRNDSLLLSVLFGNGAEPTLRVNAFPGIIDTGRFDIGGFLWASPSEGLIVGLNVSLFPLGLALQGGGDPSKQIL